MNDYTNLEHPIVILIRGLPGSGKSHLAAALRDSIGADAVVMLDPDATDYESEAYREHCKTLAAEGVDAALYPYRFLRAQAYEGISSHKIVIWNQPFTNLEIFEKMIARLRTHAAEQGTSLPIVVVEIEIDPAVAKERVMTRKRAGGHGPSDTTFTRFTSEYTSSADQGYDIVPVNGQDDVSVSVTPILKAVEKLI